MPSLTEIRDGLIRQLENAVGVISVGVSKKSGKFVLMVAVDSSFNGAIPQKFEGLDVIVEDLGQAKSQIPG